MRIRNEERGSGTRNEDRERGTRIWNGVRDTLRPCLNSAITLGNEDPPCLHMGGRVTLFLDVKLGVNASGTTLSVIGNQVMY